MQYSMTHSGWGLPVMHKDDSPTEENAVQSGSFSRQEAQPQRKFRISIVNLFE